MMKKLTLSLLMLMLFCAPALAQDLPRIAVYVTGDVRDNEKKAFGTRMLASLINSGKYMGIERSNSFLAEIEKEQVKQRSGAIDDSQISELGKQFGVKYVCIADITPAFGSYQVSARIVDVETAVVVHIGEARSSLKTMKDLAQASDDVVGNMFGGQIEFKTARKHKSGMSIGGGAVFSGDFGGGIEWGNSGGRVAMPYYGGGAYLFFDAKYAEAFAAYSAGGGKWGGPSAVEDELHEMQRSSVSFGVFGKYPIALGSVSLFPLLGVDYEASVSGKLVRKDRNDYVFDGQSGRPKAGDLSALWFKFGGGADYDLNETVYLRGELLYGLRTANAFEKDGVDKSAEANTTAKLGNGLTLRVGVGMKF